MSQYALGEKDYFRPQAVAADPPTAPFTTFSAGGAWTPCPHRVSCRAVAQKKRSSISVWRVDTRVGAKSPLPPREFTEFTEFTEATNAREVDIDGINRHRLSPFNAHYLTSL